MYAGFDKMQIAKVKTSNKHCAGKYFYIQNHLNHCQRTDLLPCLLSLSVNLKRSAMPMHKESTRQCQVSRKACCFSTFFFSEYTVLAWAYWRHQYKLTLLFEGSLCLLIVYSKKLTRWEWTKCSNQNSAALQIRSRYTL